MNTAKTAFLMMLLMGLFIAVGYGLGGEQGMIIAFGLAFLMNVFSYWFSDKIVLALYRAREVDEADAPRLYAVVRRLIQRAGMPMPKVCIIPQAAPNAFATGRNPSHAAVAVTQGLLDMLDDDALEGVIAHELSHVGNRDILIGTIAATIAGAIMILARMAQFAAIFGGGRDRRGNPFALIVVGIVSFLAALLIQMAISRSREYQADASAAKLTGNPQGLMRALDSLQRGAQRVPMEAGQATAHMFIVNPFTRKGFSGLFSTHPPIEERIERLSRMQ
jgi:heat shock protein HtpX